MFKLHHDGNVSAAGRKFVLFARQTGWASGIFLVLIRTDQKLKINKIVVKEGDRIKPQNQGIPRTDSVVSSNNRSQSQGIPHTDSVKNGNDY